MSEKTSRERLKNVSDQIVVLGRLSGFFKAAHGERVLTEMYLLMAQVVIDNESLKKEIEKLKALKHGE